MNKEKMKGIAIGLILCVLLATSGMAIANSTAETKQLTYGINVVVNGVQAQFADDMRPFTVDNRTFLSLRAISEMLSLPVEYYSSTNTVYIGDRNPPAGLEISLSPPTNLQWSETEPGTFHWDTVPGVTHYQMYLFRDNQKVSDVEGTESVFTMDVDTPGKIILDGELDTGAYTFMVRSGYHYSNTRIYSDWSDLSPVYYYVKPSTSLPTPKGLSWDLDDRSTLLWTPVSGARIYMFEVSRDGVPDIGTSAALAPLSSLDFSEFLPDIEYQVRIKALSSDIEVACNSEWSEWSPKTKLQ
jgi:hypothetical protein